MNVNDADKNKGIYKKFRVERTDGSSAPGGKHEHCRYFVLDLDHDPYAIEALKSYARACANEFPKLAHDLEVITQVHQVHRDEKKTMDNETQCIGSKGDTPLVEPTGSQKDELYDTAKTLVIEEQRAALHLLQTHPKIGFVPAALLLDELERNGVIGPFNENEPRKVLIANPRVDLAGASPTQVQRVVGQTLPEEK
jgi:hypothetical protein